MNVLLVNKFFRRRAGAETVFFDTAELLRGAGHTIVPFAMKDDANEHSEWDDYFTRPRSYTSGGIVGRSRDAAASIYSIEARRQLRRLLRVFRPDVAHIHNIYHQLTLSIVDELRDAGVPIVMTVHDYKPVCPNYKLLTHDGVCVRCVGHSFHHAVVHRCVKDSRAASAVAALEATLSRWRGQYGKIDRVIAPSEFLRDILVAGRIALDRIDVVPNPVKLVHQPSREPDGSPTFVYFGRLAPEKGLSTLLDSVALLGADVARIIVFGSGPMRAELEARVQREGLPVEFRGFAPPEVVAQALRPARAAVLPSVWYENCPMSVLEASAQGVPTIASRIGGVPELVEDGRTGVLVPPGDAHALAAALASLSSSPDLAVSLGEAAREHVERRHHPTAYLAAILRSYHRAGAEAIQTPVTVGSA